MGLISTIKDLLGLSDREPQQRREVEVTVERKPSTTSERAVKEPVASASSSEAREADTETDAVEPSPRSDEPETATEEEESGAKTEASQGAEAEAGEGVEANAGKEAEIEGTEGVELDAGEDQQDSDEDSSAGSTDAIDDEAADDPLQSIKGIGDAYAARLEDVGVEDTGDLARVDPREVAESADVPEARLERWRERARDRLGLDE